MIYLSQLNKFKMKEGNKNSGMIILLLLIALIGCKQEIHTPMDLLEENIIPLPANIEATGSSFKLKPSTVIYFPEDNIDLRNLASTISSSLESISGVSYPLVSSSQASKKDIIKIAISEEMSTSQEAYELIIDEKGIDLIGVSPAGIYMGLQTLMQLLPEKRVQQEFIEIASG